MNVTEAKWELIAERKLNLVGTRIYIEYTGVMFNYHVHRETACHGAFDTLGEAKARALVTVDELMEMGVDP